MRPIIAHNASVLADAGGGATLAPEATAPGRRSRPIRVLAMSRWNLTEFYWLGVIRYAGSG